MKAKHGGNRSGFVTQRSVSDGYSASLQPLVLPHQATRILGKGM